MALKNFGIQFETVNRKKFNLEHELEFCGSWSNFIYQNFHHWFQNSIYKKIQLQIKLKQSLIISHTLFK
ncbi:hypothetical protein BpHYR1_044573 [Brachionus plicatilis]|uniref:Uncharacterized protein n=1 Tax=Brachionus plicatilis TaxID=10195 RepID=A0A3M7R154_BRAPC|nr:hypothetical protein BpHYR1_044573 [Brachionus plicatilis]